jgi:hypothetical protein
MGAAMGIMVYPLITGWWYTYPSEEYYSVGMIIRNIWNNKKCSKPPIR